MMTRRGFTILSAALWGAGFASAGAGAAPQAFRFEAIEGGPIDLADFAGRPVLVVNTASRCGFTGQYEDMQALYDRYRDRGLVVLAVPSNDFRQELADNEAVRDFCDVNFGLDLPMTEITPVRGEGAHPFYRWLAEAHGFRPSWNFSKVLIGPDGSYVNGWGPLTGPNSGAITRSIEALLG